MVAQLEVADAHQLADHLWVGGELDPASPERARLQLEELATAARISSVIDCRFDGDDIEWVTEAAPQIDYLHLGVRDTGLRMPGDWFDDGIGYALEQIGQGRIVLTHCQAGINRGPSMAYAILLAQGWDAVEALDHIRSVRPEARIGYAEDAVLWMSLKAGDSSTTAKNQMDRVRQWRARVGLPRRSEERFGETR